MTHETVEGRNAVLEALRSGRPLNKIFIARGIRPAFLAQLQQLARKRGVVVQEVDRKRLDEMAVTRNHQGVIAQAMPKEYVCLEDILAIARDRQEDPFLLLLDGIEDPYNLGALLRTAEAAGVHGVVIPKRRAAGLTAAVARASAGAVEYVAVARVPNLAQCIEELKSLSIWVVGSDPQGKDLYAGVDLTGPIAIVIGGEGHGIHRLVKEKCDFLVRLPMRGRISSLNASVAGSLVLYEVVRQRTWKEG